jgi:hypothetical protein
MSLECKPSGIISVRILSLVTWEKIFTAVSKRGAKPREKWLPLVIAPCEGESTMSRVFGMKGFRRAFSAVLLCSLAGLLVVGLLDLDLRGGSDAEEEEKMSEARGLCASQVCSKF